jgi:asparagine synthase (glutamine-hydrolysing)
MSGIAGIFRRDGGAARAPDLSRMVTAIAHRGPDGSSTWNSGAAGLAHCMLWTTPESLNERLPHSQSGGSIVITSDARIDNREELMGALGMAQSETYTDSELILAAYEKWGEDCPSRLIGDFAFAIWDAPRQHLFCARDAMGIRSFYYYVSDSLFAFASEIKGITCLPEVPKRLEEVRILDYLINLFDDRQLTFYKDILRLPAATAMTVTRDNVNKWVYWTLDPFRELRLKSNEEYTEAFRTTFTEAVRCRMRSSHPVAIALSGGLDSSSIACTARHIMGEAAETKPIDTISLIFPGLPQEDLRYIDERQHMNHALNQGGFRPHFIQADQLSPLADVSRVQYHLDEANFAGNLYLHWAMYQKAQANGNRVFLDGLDGDTTISHGYERLADLLIGLRWRTLAREISLLARNQRLGRKYIIRNFCIMPFCPSWMYKLRDRLRGRRGDVRIYEELLKPEFKLRLHLPERVNSVLPRSRACLRSAREKHWEMLNFPLYAHALEMADKSSAAFSVEARYPFFDRRMIELCLSLPADQKLADGWSRLILRRAMEGILPKEIQWRPAKGNLSPNFYRGLSGNDRAVIEKVAHGSSAALAQYVNVQAFRRACERFLAKPMWAQEDSLQIFAAVNLALWLDTAGLAP